MSEWLPPDHLVWFVLEVVDQLDTAVFHDRYVKGGPGRAAYDPQMLLAVLVYAYAVGQRSSRQIERLCSTDVAFRIACGQDVPDHTTIARFRARHEDAFAGLFTQVLMLCAQAGMGRVGTVAIDGTKIAANASLGANRTEAWLSEQARRIVAEAAAVDAAEDDELGDARGDELPEEFTDPGTRAARIRAALEQVRAKQAQTGQGEAAQRAKAEEFLARVKAGHAPPGRPPAGVDPVELAQARLEREEKRLAQATEATDARERNGRRTAVRRARRGLEKAQAQRLLAQTAPAKRTAKQTERQASPAEAKANTTDPDSRMMSSRRGWIQGYNAQIAVSDDHLILAATVTQDAADVAWFTPMMNIAVTAAEAVWAAHPAGPADAEEHDSVDNPDTDTAGGPVQTVLADAGYLSVQNLTAPGPDRLIALGPNHRLHREAREHPATGAPPPGASPTEQMSHRLRTRDGAQAYKRRGATVEPVIGHLKDQIGLRRFSRRGLSAVASELNLAAMVANLLKLRQHTTPALA